MEPAVRPTYRSPGELGSDIVRAITVTASLFAEFSDVQIVQILNGYAAERGLSFVAYWDDGEWHAHMLDNETPVATARGGNSREANEALLPLLGLG